MLSTTQVIEIFFLRVLTRIRTFENILPPQDYSKVVILSWEIHYDTHILTICIIYYYYYYVHHVCKISAILLCSVEFYTERNCHKYDNLN